jgi:hypothetical protein
MPTSPLTGELRANFREFDKQWLKELIRVTKGSNPDRPTFESSYSRIASIQAWRTTVISEVMDADSAAFFFEAQNDLLVSHCLARCGSFRQALKSLRSSIENICYALYYKDHPVELLNWEKGKHRLGFRELHHYFTEHPLLSSVSTNLNGLGVLSGEYATLSKAVHASAKRFRMTTDLVDTKLWIQDKSAIGQWNTRERAVIVALNQLLLHMLSDHLQGAKHRALRETAGLLFSKPQKIDIKKRLGVLLI